ncbi:YggS family pyridoxal phosphate-dependent enzyme [Aerococcus urinae]|uniref:Pyridoxal phosphate homeostasis protein n=1 Tax=Aerococcus urinae TaxID=1376 RepID=A0A109RED4_9LACT|nr:YggS family pyridoxal phosphate-dependent enzyme [Aerococcus urinae]AMB95530.1 YggS family pyridoxal phosphate enzyme [Aerococcus urinae]MCY3032610.1 YggS family pyridoxal phosphate-dependent enzyme [Aerococcus urinae]MCY3037911.1 YggS family pyridoxal phosphate-dependent enzyme [Aerococcus urinae]MCY3044656.1 YggS family pyridoxal phosphate-dependent enzyme [Aerococcus urinae]MCY3045793.1 YggS family pyridoxal phosphate-dependent enzyme [Aerococcus urinae]
MTIQANVKQIEGIIEDTKQSACSSNKVTLICVSKYHSPEEAMAVYHCGIRHFAENYVQGLLAKKAAMPDDVIWHLIGPLQSRKVKEVINEIDYYHALDRIKIAKEIDKRAAKAIKCFVEVNISGETSKHGLTKEETLPFIEQLAEYKKIKVVGLMTMAPSAASDSEVQEIFSQLASLRDQVADQQWMHAPCTELSMGMSQDYPLAIKEGASFIRVGSAFFKD